MMVGVSKWPYDQYNIDRRQQDCDYYGDPSDKCKNEAWFIRELSQQLQEKFEIERNLTFAFMDSFSQSGPNLNDEVQQSHWIEETNKLWSEATSRNETFDFKTIDDVLEENALCKEENNRLNDIIAEDIKQLKENVTSLDNKIIRNEEKIIDNKSSMVLLSKDVEDLTDSGTTAAVTKVSGDPATDIDWETWESCLVDIGPAEGISDADQYGEVETTAGFNIDDYFYDFEGGNGTSWSSVSGILGYSFGAFKVWPRSAADLVE